MRKYVKYLCIAVFLLIFSLLSLFWKNKRRLKRTPCCLSVYSSVSLYLPLIFFDFYAAHVISRRLIRSPFCLCVCVSPNCFVFCAVRVLSDKIRRLVLPRTSCYYLLSISKVHVLNGALSETAKCSGCLGFCHKRALVGIKYNSNIINCINCFHDQHNFDKRCAYKTSLIILKCPTSYKIMKPEIFISLRYNLREGILGQKCNTSIKKTVIIL
jgi:hypothetical protein